VLENTDREHRVELGGGERQRCGRLRPPWYEAVRAGDPGAEWKVLERVAGHLIAERGQRVREVPVAAAPVEDLRAAPGLPQRKLVQPSVLVGRGTAAELQQAHRPIVTGEGHQLLDHTLDRRFALALHHPCILSRRHASPVRSPEGLPCTPPGRCRGERHLRSENERSS
jgi:hypothetical protein